MAFTHIRALFLGAWVAGPAILFITSQSFSYKVEDSRLLPGTSTSVGTSASFVLEESRVSWKLTTSSSSSSYQEQGEVLLSTGGSGQEMPASRDAFIIY